MFASGRYREISDPLRNPNPSPPSETSTPGKSTGEGAFPYSAPSLIPVPGAAWMALPAILRCRRMMQSHNGCPKNRWVKVTNNRPAISARRRISTHAEHAEPRAGRTIRAPDEARSRVPGGVAAFLGWTFARLDYRPDLESPAGPLPEPFSPTFPRPSSHTGGHPSSGPVPRVPTGCP